MSPGSCVVKHVWHVTNFLFPQLEGRVEDLLTELKESRDRLVQQDQAAKAALQQAQKDMAHRVEQVRPGHKHCGSP